MAGCFASPIRSITKAGSGPLPEVSADVFVNFLNERADRLKTIEFNDTRMRVSGKGIPVPATLDGNLAAAQPRYFRMVSSGRIASAKLDMGSNPQEFWVYVAAPGDTPMYVFASHSDFESGKAKGFELRRQEENSHACSPTSR